MIKPCEKEEPFIVFDMTIVKVKEEIIVEMMK